MRCLTFFLTLLAAAVPPGVDPDRIARIPVRMKEFVDKGTIAGAVTLVQRHGALVSLEAVGYADLEKKIPMRPDTIFRIASMTKPFTAAGILILAEEGRIGLADPVEKYLPDFKGQWVVESREADTRRTLKHPARPVTIRDLLTHTSGMYGMPPETLEDAMARSPRTLSEVMLLASQKPLDFEPGAQWQYSNLGIAALGRIIEVVADQPYEKFIEARIFKPLGMQDSFFFAPEEKKARIAVIYIRDKGALKKAPWDFGGKDQKYPFPEGGMASTAKDLAAFYQAMLNGGKPILSRAGVEVMTARHTGALRPAWGLGWSLVKDAGGELSLRSIGTYGHGGAFGTQGWIDPKKDLVGVFLIQRPGGSDEFNAFAQIVGSSILD